MDLSAALTVMDTPVHIPGTSTQDLVNKVQAELAGLPPSPNTKRICPATGVDGGLSTRPIDAMLELALATRIHVSDDVLQWFGHWAWLRYLGAFDLTGAAVKSTRAELVLSEAGLRVRGNQRRVMSEELGVGFGVLVGKLWCQYLGHSRAPIVVDVDVALREERRWIQSWGGPLESMGRQPDYLLILPVGPGSRQYDVKVLECKGTVSQSNVVGQLARATTQLASLTLNGITPSGIAVATISGPTGIRYAAVDPPNEAYEGRVTVTDEDLSSARLRGVYPGHSGGVRDLPSGVFIAGSLLSGMGALADFAGNSAAASELLPPEIIRHLRRRPRSRITVETGVGNFRGEESVFSTPEGGPPLRIFTGVAAEMDDALTSGTLEGFEEAQEVVSGRHDFYRETNGQIGVDGVAAVNEDGALLLLRP